MRIAIIVKSDQSVSFESQLISAGHMVDVCHLGDDYRQSMVLLANFMAEVEDFDLIHNLAGAPVMAFAGLSAVPMLSTVTEPVANAVGGNQFFVSLSRLDGVDFVIDDESGYLPVYEKIQAATAREDIRPWGFYEVLSDDVADHKIKRITVYPGKRLSLQKHERRKEHWLLVSGRARVTLDQEFIDLGPGEAVDIPCNAAHRIENCGEEDVVFIEVQQGDYFGEDDIIRLEDDYGRA